MGRCGDQMNVAVSKWRAVLYVMEMRCKRFSDDVSSRREIRTDSSRILHDMFRLSDASTDNGEKLHHARVGYLYWFLGINILREPQEAAYHSSHLSNSWVS